MSNYLTINEVCSLLNTNESDFQAKYINSGMLSITIDSDGSSKVELSELLRVFPGLRYEKKINSTSNEQEIELYKQKVEHLEYVIASLERQLSEQKAEHQWLKTKYDSTNLLLEQKLDTSEIEKYKEELKGLTKSSLEWERKYNTLLAASELKNVLRENQHLKAELTSQVNQVQEERLRLFELERELQAKEVIKKSFKPDFKNSANQELLNTEPVVTNVLEGLEPEDLRGFKKRRRKFLGIF